MPRTCGRVIAEWREPDLDELIEALEYAYQQRDAIGQIGARAAADLTAWSWNRAARQFLDLLTV